MNINNVEGLLSYQLLSTVLKKSLGDGTAFDIIMESLMKADVDGSMLNLLEGSYAQGTLLEDLTIDSLEDMGAIKQAIITSGSRSTSQISSEDITSERQRINAAVSKYSKEYGIDEALVHAIIKQESNYNPQVVSKAGAMGLMQLMPVNCQEDGVENPFNIEENIEGGIKQMKRYLDKYKNLELSLMAYNAGAGTVKRRGVTSLEDLYKMPKETQGYVKKVTSYYNELKSKG